MPSLGADMDAGTLTQWLVKPGDPVRRGDIVAVVDTEKSTIEVEIFENGVIQELVVGEGENVPVGAVLARVGRPDGATVAPARPPRESAVPLATPEGGNGLAAVEPEEQPAPPLVRPPSPPTPLPHPSPVVHSPVVRHLADRLGVDPARLAGTGPGGEVTRADVTRAAELAQKRVETSPAPTARVRSSPLARRLAAEVGLDMTMLTGTGPDGAVIARDLAGGAKMPEPAATAAQPDGKAVRADRQATLRKAIGALMARSKREVPHYYLSTTIDVGAASCWLEEANMVRSVQNRLVLPVLLIKATARAVAKVPEMNGFFADDAFTPSAAVHVGVAVSLRSGGVVAPAIHDAAGLDLDELMAKLRDLVGRARAGVLRSSEMSNPTITVTNLGDLGVESVFGVIYPPQVALVGFGQVTERAIAKEGLVGARPCVTATLSADHRVSDGHRGGRFLAEINRLLQEPEKL